MAELHRADAVELEASLEALLAAHPDAGVAAVDDNGRFCEIPASVPMMTQHQLEGRAGIDLVLAESRRAVLDQFAQVKRYGASSIDVKAADGHDATFHLLDVRDRHGVFVLVLVVDPDSDAEAPVLPKHRPLRARHGRIVRDELAVALEVDDAAQQLTGFSAEELIGRDPADFIHPDDREIALANWFDVLTSAADAGRRWRGRQLRQDGSYLWVEFTNYNRLQDPDRPCVLSEMIDISDEMAAVEAVRDGRELLERLTEALPLGVLQIDGERRVVYRNERLCQIVGIEDRATVDEQLANVVDEDRTVLLHSIDTVLGSGTAVDAELRIRLPRAYVPRVCEVAFRSLRSQSGEVSGAIMCLSDVTERAILRQELEARATFDLLTHCYNRGSIMTQLEAALARSNQADVGVAVVFVDLDRFKPINDELGHAAGDELLVEVADRLRSGVRVNDLVGRLGGDEFLAVCPDVNGHETAQRIAERIARQLVSPAQIGDHAVEVRASIGVAWSHDPDTTADALVARADAAMYEAKRRGSGAPVLDDGHSH